MPDTDVIEIDRPDAEQGARKPRTKWYEKRSSRISTLVLAALLPMFALYGVDTYRDLTAPGKAADIADQFAPPAGWGDGFVEDKTLPEEVGSFRYFELALDSDPATIEEAVDAAEAAASAAGWSSIRVDSDLDAEVPTDRPTGARAEITGYAGGFRFSIEIIAIYTPEGDTFSSGRLEVFRSSSSLSPLSGIAPPIAVFS